jgi:hypothetical protein
MNPPPADEFPMIGNFQGVFSKHWNFLSRVFQGLELFHVIFPSIGSFAGRFSNDWRSPGKVSGDVVHGMNGKIIRSK